MNNLNPLIYFWVIGFANEIFINSLRENIIDEMPLVYLNLKP